MDDENTLLEGARKLISDGFFLDKADKLLVLTHEKCIPTAKYVVKAARLLGMEHLTLIQTPEMIRPLTKVSEAFVGAMEKSDAVIHMIDRMPEESQFNLKVFELCNEKRIKYCLLYDPEPRYFGEGIGADYTAVEEKCRRIAGVLRESEQVEVSSALGTHLRFSVYQTIMTRGPAISRQTLWNQAPEGEVMTCPVETTFNGGMVIDGPITSVGTPKRPVFLEFERGMTTRVDGGEEDLSNLLKAVRRADHRVESLLKIWIAEFSLGANDWAVLDDNISNCEKVSGAIHFAVGLTTFAMGKTAANAGVDRGETFHNDCIMKCASVTATTKAGEKVQLIDSGRLLV